jgi:membrane protein YdbS with pleckstrin-like domain
MAIIEEARVRVGSIGGVIIIIWLLIGAVAAGQRGYFGSSTTTCAKAGTIAVTVVAGPLNYLGVNPKIKCTVPQPSQ